MNKKKSKALAFLLAASLLVPSVNGIVSAAELDNVKSTDKVVASQEATNPDGSDTSTQDPLTQNVAKIGDKEYATLKEAINNAGEGATITLLGNVTEDITVNKNITIDGQNKYTISGYTILEKGKLENVTLKAGEDKVRILLIGSESKNTILMNNVTIVYSVDKRYYETSMVCGNESNIRIENCTFTNYPNNGENVNMVSEWSYGLSLAPQKDKQGKLIKYNKGNVEIINNTFDGAFRTMIPSINGNVTIKGNTFKNRVETVAEGPTGGAGPQATCITTDDKTKNKFFIQNNIFDNAGAFLFQDIADVRGNTFKFDRFSAHYIQRRRHVENKEIDLRNNIFEMGENKLKIMDSASTPVILPANVNAIAFWTWSSAEGTVDPNQINLSNYEYKFNGDGTKTYYPSSEKALKEFVNPRDVNDTSVRNKEKVVVSDNMTIEAETAVDIPKDKNITIEVPKGKTLTLNSAGAIDVTGSLTISGDGEVEIAKSGEVSVNKDATLNITTNVDNKGTIDNNGAINNGGRISNSGKLTNNSQINNSGKISNSGEIVSESGKKGEISNSGTIATQEGGSIERNDINKEGNGTTVSPNEYKPVEIKEAYKTSNSITMSVDDLGKFNKLGEVEFTIVEGSVTESRGGNWVRAIDGKVTFDGLNPNTKYTVFARYKGLGNTEVKMEVSTLSPSTGGGGVVAPTYTHEEIIGSDRYDTAAKIADKLGSYDNVVLVNAESSMSDGLSASGLAGKENGAILLTKKDSIPKATMDRIKKVKKVYIIGGEAAISAKVANELTAARIKVERLGGKDRVETSEIVAKKLGNYSDAFVVNGFKGEADAMSASAIAAKKGAPILLTNGKTSTHAKKSGVEYYVIGGNSVVDKSIADKYNAEVLAGKDRYATNKEVINEFYSGSDKVYIANGDKLVDVLTASPLAKKDGIVLVNEKSDKSILKGKNTVQVGGMDFEIEFEK